jgi:hypothetical protein
VIINILFVESDIKHTSLFLQRKNLHISLFATFVTEMCRLTHGIDLGTTCITTIMFGAKAKLESPSSTGNNIAI